MQGQSSPVRTLAKNFLADNGSTSNADAVDCPMSWNGLQTSALNRLPDYHTPSNGGRNAEWCFGESSSSAVQHPGVSDKDHERHSGSGIPPLDVINLSSSSSQRTNGLFLFQNSASVSHTRDLNMNADYEDEEDEEEYLVDHSNSTFKAIDISNERSYVSGYRGFVMEEREDEPGFSLNPRRMPCKRKAIEVCIGQSPGAGGSDCSERAHRNQWRTPQVVADDINLPLPTDGELAMNNGTDRPSLRIRIGVGESVSTNPSFFTVSEHGESSNRNSHLNASAFRGQDQVSGNQFLTEADVRCAGTSSLQHSSRLPLCNYMFDSTVAPGLRGNHQRRWNGGSSRRASSSSTSGVRDAAVFTEMTSRNIPRSISEHPMFLPGNEIGNSLEHPANWSSSSLEANIGSTYRPGSSSGGRYSSSSSLRSNSRYHQRLSEMMRRSLIPSTGSDSGALDTTSQDVGNPSVPDSHRRRAMNSRSAALLERHLDGVPHSLRSLASAGEGRRNIMTEQIRHVLDLMRRGESLRFEDMMILDHSLLFGMAEMNDRHRDMRMDVDNMSYEELLALEERIGNVCIGLSEEAIASNLKKRKYNVTLGVDETCCICREEYIAGEDVGELNCGHEFHTDCIKQWLMQKNLCPICKTTGLNK